MTSNVIEFRWPADPTDCPRCLLRLAAVAELAAPMLLTLAAVVLS
ncbi:MAG TPA: hypothetical protein VF329_13530 [Gammaproteobacteria bacterium]